MLFQFCQNMFLCATKNNRGEVTVKVTKSQKRGQSRIIQE